MQTATVSSTALDLPAPAAQAAHPAMSRIYLLETKYEFLKLFRTPVYLIGTLGFPVMFYLLFGVAMAPKSNGQIGAAEYLLASYCVFGTVTAALFAFGAGVAVERASGWMTLKRATPLPPSAYLGAKVLASMTFGTIILVLMGTAAFTMGGVRFPPLVWLRLWAVLVLGCIPFCLGGLVIAFTVPPTGAPGIVNMINLPLSFASGLWFPIMMLPKFIQAVAPILPQYHVAQLALGAVGAVDQPNTVQHLLALLAATLVLGVIAQWAWKRSEMKAS